LEGVREAGSGTPRDEIRLSVAGVKRMAASRADGPSAVRGVEVYLRFDSADGSPLDRKRWEFLVPDRYCIPYKPVVRGLIPESGRYNFCPTGEEYWGIVVPLWVLGEPEDRIPRLVVDLGVLRIERAGRLAWDLSPGQDLHAAFLNRRIFLGFEKERIFWGSYRRDRWDRPGAKETCFQGLLDEFSFTDANGLPLRLSSAEGRSTGETCALDFSDGGPPAYPIHVEARWRPCGPTTTCRFEIEDIPIPGPEPVDPPDTKK
jgi:hypothetical protein